MESQNSSIDLDHSSVLSRCKLLSKKIPNIIYGIIIIFKPHKLKLDKKHSKWGVTCATLILNRTWSVDPSLNLHSGLLDILLVPKPGPQNFNP